MGTQLSPVAAWYLRMLGPLTLVAFIRVRRTRTPAIFRFRRLSGFTVLSCAQNNQLRSAGACWSPTSQARVVTGTVAIEHL
ncbi:hypothetical protein KCP73_16900 [Salmonella enterica subsp. enterica]|nr:hypothetical protein KCP73_16900 [Salmonella enterica subsp. enterica]